MTMRVRGAVAEFERDRLIGGEMGQPLAFSESRSGRAEILIKPNQGSSMSAIANERNTSRQTIMRIRAANDPLGASPRPYLCDS